MTTVAKIAAELGMCPKRARRIMRKSTIVAHEKGTAWELNEIEATDVRNTLMNAMTPDTSVTASERKAVERDLNAQIRDDKRDDRDSERAPQYLDLDGDAFDFRFAA